MNKKETTRQRHNRLLKEKSQSMKVIEALETGIHIHYDYNVASKKKGFRFIFDRLLIKDFIKEKRIKDVKESQFRYMLNKIHKEMQSMGLPDSVLFTVGYFLRQKEYTNFVYLYSRKLLAAVYVKLKARNKAKAVRMAKKAAKEVAKRKAEEREKESKNDVSGASGCTPVIEVTCR